MFGGFDLSKGWRSALLPCRQGQRSLTFRGALLCCGRTYVDKTRTSVILSDLNAWVCPASRENVLENWCDDCFVRAQSSLALLLSA